MTQKPGVLTRPAAAPTSDDIGALLRVLPPKLRAVVDGRPDLEQMIEVVLDLGRRPEARFPGATALLDAQPVGREDLAHITAQVGAFTSDNRAGIERTLHRVSAIRNRAGHVVGLTCRVGRAVVGAVEIVRDVIESGRCVLLLGPPGVGKTTILRDAARVLASEAGKRVIVVDTSNEIGGDGDIPHPGIGLARRMQVASPDRQHAVMIEAVENHMPEVIVIDEIGTEAEAAAARTIAERGVQLVATAHGHSLDNLLANPTLADLVGGIQAVTLGDEEARRRRTQKTVLERKQTPTFDELIEIQTRDRVAVHHQLAQVVDARLRGHPAPAELRVRDEIGSIEVRPLEHRPAPRETRPHSGRRLIRIHPHAVSEERIERAILSTGAPARIAHSVRDADLILTLRSLGRRQPAKLREAMVRDLPVRLLRSGSVASIEEFLVTLRRERDGQAGADDSTGAVTAETEAAARDVLDHGEPVELPAQPAATRRLQHAVAERLGIRSVSRGREPSRRVVLLPSST
ncbi:MAG: AAA family ATPase [Deltaproteobacteria bacterium]|nr:AAA family ATPase [Deltaproteobacteria bacterium]